MELQITKQAPNFDYVMEHLSDANLITSWQSSMAWLCFQPQEWLNSWYTDHHHLSEFEFNKRLASDLHKKINAHKCNLQEHEACILFDENLVDAVFRLRESVRQCAESWLLCCVSDKKLDYSHASIREYVSKYYSLQNAVGLLLECTFDWCYHNPPGSRYKSTRYPNIDMELQDILDKAKAIKLSSRKKAKRSLTNDARKVLIKSTELASSFLSPGDISIFLKGDALTIQGSRYDFQVKKYKSTSLTHTSHGGFDVCLYDKHTNYLCDLCIFWDEMPVLDQLVALIAMIQSGQEIDLIKVANASNKQKLFYNDNTLTKLKPEKKIEVVYNNIVGVDVTPYMEMSQVILGRVKKHAKKYIYDVYKNHKVAQPVIGLIQSVNFNHDELRASLQDLSGEE